MKIKLTYNHGGNNHLPAPLIAISSVAETLEYLQNTCTQKSSIKHYNKKQILTYNDLKMTMISAKFKSGCPLSG